MYPEITEVTQVALEGSPSNAPLRSGAACAGDTQFDWIPAVETDTVPAGMATLCQACPAQTDCLAWAMAWDADGYWAGTTTAQRRGRGRSDQQPTHEGPGSASLYRQGCHCRECKDAHNDRIHNQRARNRGAA